MTRRKLYTIAYPNGIVTGRRPYRMSKKLYPEGTRIMTTNEPTDRKPFPTTIQGINGEARLPSGFTGKINGWSADLRISPIDTTRIDSGWVDPTYALMSGSCYGTGKPGVPQAKGTLTLTATTGCTYAFTAVFSNIKFHRNWDGKTEITFDFKSSGPITQSWDMPTDAEAIDAVKGKASIFDIPVADDKPANGPAANSTAFDDCSPEEVFGNALDRIEGDVVETTGWVASPEVEAEVFRRMDEAGEKSMLLTLGEFHELDYEPFYECGEGWEVVRSTRHDNKWFAYHDEKTTEATQIDPMYHNSPQAALDAINEYRNRKAVEVSIKASETITESMSKLTDSLTKIGDTLSDQKSMLSEVPGYTHREPSPVVQGGQGRESITEDDIQRVPLAAALVVIGAFFAGLLCAWALAQMVGGGH